MLHGLLVGSCASWYFTAAPVLARQRTVVLYDLRGHGRSERAATGYDVGTMTRDLLGVLDGTVGDGPVDLVGHSYGALIALRCALEHPARVGRLGLVEAPLPPSKAIELSAFLSRSPEEMMAALPTVQRDALQRERRQSRRMLENLRALAVDTTLLADLAAEKDVDDAALAGLRAPTLCVFGESSTCRPVGARLGRVIGGARLAILPGGHFLHLESPGPLTAALAEHLDG
jgi:pimeloyl-ACP methyl ester carboxylesterase